MALHPAYSSFKLVFTAASERELPAKWIKAHGFPILTAKAVMSRAISQTARPYPESTILFIISGAGPQNAQKTAEAIIQHLKPWAVVNLGTCGYNQLDNKWRPGQMIFPEFTLGPGKTKIRCMKHPPFPLPNQLEARRVEAVESLSMPLLHIDPAYAIFVDMEAWFQHLIFSRHGLPFCCLKVVTDSCSSTTPADYKRHLSLAAKQIKEAISFLGQPASLPEISVIIPVHNRAWSIKRAIDSVLCQSLPPCEVIVVDDGSTDDTPKILRGYGRRIIPIIMGKNQGVSTARNKGIEISRGKWLAFLDSDDQWGKDKLLHHAQYIKKYPFLQVLQCEEIWIRKGRRVNKRRYHEKKAGWIWDLCLERCMVSPSCAIIKRDLIERYGLFDVRMPACEDYDLWLRISRHHPIGLDKCQDVIRYGGHSDQLSMKYTAMDRFRVFSLIKALETEDEPSFYQRIKKEIQKRLSILEGGALKRGRLIHAKMYRQVMKKLEANEFDHRECLTLLDWTE